MDQFENEIRIRVGTLVILVKNVRKSVGYLHKEMRAIENIVEKVRLTIPEAEAKGSVETSD